jgi:hypothetical protein
LKTISFYVNVPKIGGFLVHIPVLSDRRYSIRPSYSGILEFLAIVPGMPLSRVIFKEKVSLASSKLTLIDI